MTKKIKSLTNYTFLSAYTEHVGQKETFQTKVSTYFGNVFPTGAENTNPIIAEIKKGWLLLLAFGQNF